MHANRSQFPVGQGCFHAGCISQGTSATRDLGDFHYIYDCGSNTMSALREAIGAYRKQTSHVDALFVSHLHEDHVNGIDKLLGAVTVDTVYLPYANDVLSLLNLIEADMDGALSASLVEATIDPRSWFGRRGVSHVVRVLAWTADESDFAEDDVEVDDGPYDERSRVVRADLDGETKSPPPVRTRTTMEEIESGSIVKISIGRDTLDWILVPHVDPTPIRRLTEFRKALKKACGLRPRQWLTATRMADALRTRSKRLKLRNCYEKIISGGSRHNHNRVSMSLYSGPPSVVGSKQAPFYSVIRRTANWSIYSRSISPDWFWSLKVEAPGWIGTGDATLKNTDVRTAWRKTFDRFRHEIGTLLLPHHGSERNFHHELLDFPDLKLCVASAGDPSPYNHPSVVVVDKVVKNGKHFHCTSANPLSGLREEINKM